jgi:putative oxidoreductase
MGHAMHHRNDHATDLGLLTLRLTTGGLLAGHGAQKLFGFAGGHGIHGTAGMMQMIGMKPGHVWGTLAGAAEFGGGMMTALGLGGPLGPITTLGPMGMAIGTVHWGKPIWVTSGGAELPLTNAAVGVALALAGPGRYSLDHAFGIRVPGWLTSLWLLGTAAGIGMGLALRETEQATEQQQAPPEEHPQEPTAEVEKVLTEADEQAPLAA